MGKDAWLFGPSRALNWRKAGRGVRINPLGEPLVPAGHLRNEVGRQPLERQGGPE